MPDWEAAARRLPSGLQLRPMNPSFRPLRLKVSLPDCASHSFTAPAAEVARRLPSGLQTTPSPLVPFTVRISFPVSPSQSLSVPSWEELARRLPSGLQATQLPAPFIVRT